MKYLYKYKRRYTVKRGFNSSFWLWLLLLTRIGNEVQALSVTHELPAKMFSVIETQEKFGKKLSILSIDGISFDQSFSSDVTSYTADVEDEVVTINVKLADPKSIVDFSAVLPAVLFKKNKYSASFTLRENSPDNRIFITVSHPGYSSKITYTITLYRPLRKSFADSHGPKLIAEYKEGKIHHHWKFWDKIYDLPDGKKVRLRWRAQNCILVSNISSDSGITWSPDLIEINNFRPEFTDFIEIFQISDGSFVAYQYASYSNLVYKKNFLQDKNFEKVHEFKHYSTSLHEIKLDSNKNRLFIPRYNNGTEGNNSFSLSDDLGYTWYEVRLPVPPEEAGALVEPNFIDKLDGTLWVTYRSQVGQAIYEMFSHDHGLTWTQLRKCHFISGPTWQKSYRIPEGIYKGSLVFIWANMRQSAPEDKPFYNAGREALHVAISHDDGKTWHGFRQVNVYPLRYGDQTAKRDHGPTDQKIEFVDGKYFIYSGNGNHYLSKDRRHLSNPFFIQREIEIDFDWLKQNFAEDDFSAYGIDNDFQNGELSQWLLFKRVGNISGNAGSDRMRVPGPGLVEMEGKKVLQIRRNLNKYDDIIEPPDVATWNFPNGTKGI